MFNNEALSRGNMSDTERRYLPVVLDLLGENGLWQITGTGVLCRLEPKRVSLYGRKLENIQ